MMNINNDMKRTRVKTGMNLKGLLCAAFLISHFIHFLYPGRRPFNGYGGIQS